jgi:hypothetical protein
MSALPYVTSSLISSGQVHRYDFPFVTRFIDVTNRDTSGSIAVGFTLNGLSKGNYVTLDSKVTMNEEIRTTTLFISCSAGTNVQYQLFCGLTTIPAANFLTITGSNGHPGVG